MKWIKKRDLFLSEAKIKDLIFPRQAKEVKERWGEKYLDYEEVTPTDKIVQGIWKLSEEDKYKVLSKWSDTNMEQLFRLFQDLPEQFGNVLNKSISSDAYREDNFSKDEYQRIFSSFDIRNPKLDQIITMFGPVFRKLSIPDTMAESIISKDENNRPLRDENGNMIRTAKAKGDLAFSNNMININSFIVDYNSLVDKCVDEKMKGWSASDKVTVNFSNDRNISQFINFASTNRNTDYQLDFEIFNRDIYLKIKHNPKDILNMSISKFYASCQHLYTGSHRGMLLANVFDPNSIPAFLTFETPIFWKGEKISEQLPLSRMIIRNIEQFDDNAETKLYFDRAYEDRMQDTFEEIVTKYTGMVSSVERGNKYYFSPDVDFDDELSTPYQDRLSLEKVLRIGKNIKTLTLSQLTSGGKYIVVPNAKIKELIVETSDIPDSLLNLNLNLDWIKFKYLSINTLNNFSNVKTDSIAFDKCKFGNNILEDMNNINPNIKKLQIVSCDNTTTLDFSIFEKLEELQVIYTLDSYKDLTNLSVNKNLKKMVISGDLVTKESKPTISALKSKGIKIEIVGPII